MSVADIGDHGFPILSVDSSDELIVRRFFSGYEVIQTVCVFCTLSPSTFDTTNLSTQYLLFYSIRSKNCSCLFLIVFRIDLLYCNQPFPCLYVYFTLNFSFSYMLALQGLEDELEKVGDETETETEELQKLAKNHRRVLHQCSSLQKYVILVCVSIFIAFLQISAQSVVYRISAIKKKKSAEIGFMVALLILWNFSKL